MGADPRHIGAEGLQQQAAMEQLDARGGADDLPAMEDFQTGARVDIRGSLAADSR